MSVFRTRGKSVVVDTVDAAELEVQLVGVPEDVMERIGHSLRDLPFSASIDPSDRSWSGKSKVST